MKNLQQNILIVFALGLCLLCAGQWYRETWQRTQIDELKTLVSQKLAQIQDCTNHITILDGQIVQMDAHITEMKGTIATNDQLILVQKRELNRLEADGGSLTNQIVEYKHGIEAYQQKLKEAADGIQKQNEALKELVVQRDEFVAKLNDSVKDRNSIVEKYNELAARYEKLQGGGKSENK